MKKLLLSILTSSLLLSQVSSVLANETVVNTLLKEYESQGAKNASAQRGEILWNKSFSGKAPFTERSCKSCHTANVKNTGKHVRTGKALEPLAPSVNQASLSDIKKVKKWFKRNCKWTTGEECSPQVKADILLFLQQQ
ncbi:MAG: DUF1924 domain-containing protein [Gammaproteobacteria bacterium]|nr:DUF1924 domain-containing protein [Gammaproteobacteria bacterium]